MSGLFFVVTELLIPTGGKPAARCYDDVGMAQPAMRTLIVDDEPVARQVLREELESFADVEIVGDADNGKRALERIASLHPDLVLLDLQMPGLSGFEVIQRLAGDTVPVVIIVTAYDQHAIRAFEAGALDYLLKPVSRERLEKALARARVLCHTKGGAAESLARLSEAATPPNAGVRHRKIAARSGDEYHLLELNDVLAFQADREIVWIVTMRQRYTATQTLRQIEERLRDSGFQRVHRNAIVNVNHVRKMTPITSQRWLLTVSNGQEFIVSKRLAGTVRKMLHW